VAYTLVLIPPTQAAWRFDGPSFFIGLIVGLLIAGLLYLFRRPLSDGIETLRGRLRDLRERLSAGAERRYQEALRDRLIELHVGELAAPFEEVYLPPRLDPPPPRPSLSPERAESRSITLHQALLSTQRLGVLGLPGSGRTALLVYLAHAFLESETLNEVGLDEQRLPLLIHLAEIDWQVEYADPALGLIDAAIAHAPRLIAANLASLLRSKIASKGLLILLDGWDELAQADRDAAQAWLAALVKRAPQHRYVTTAAPDAIDLLRAVGFVPLSISPLQPRQIRALADRWASVAEGGASDAAMLAESMRQPPGAAPRPLDFTLAISVWRKRGNMPLTVPAAYDRWIDLALNESGVSDTAAARAVLGQLAWTLFETDRLITTRDETAALTGDSPPTPDGAGKASKSPADLANELATRSALFIPLGEGVAFAHRRIAAYLAATYARDTGQAMMLATRIDDPAWKDVVYFFAALEDPTPLVNAALARPDDLFRTMLKRLGSWASVAPPEAAWRNRVMGELVKLLMGPTTPEPLRDELLRTVVSTRDKSLALLFTRALARPEPSLKRLGLRGFGLMRREADAAAIAPFTADPDAEVRLEAVRVLGEIGGQAAVEALAQALLDLDDDARRAAAEALANCGKAGWELLREGATLVDEQDPDNVRIRRAVTYGLARIGESWARDLLLKLEREDRQWFVRSGATEALKSMSQDGGDGPAIDLTPLDKDNLGWLVQWSASKGQPIGLGKSAAQALQRALEDLDPTVRLAAVHSYAYLGDADIIPALRNRLQDDNPSVRAAAYRALAEIARRKSQVVPA